MCACMREREREGEREHLACTQNMNKAKPKLIVQQDCLASLLVGLGLVYMCTECL